MNIFFDETNPDTVLTAIKSAMGDRSLSKIVEFEMSDEILTVVISKVGKSKLFFDVNKTSHQLEFRFKKEKIALTHKAFKNEVTEKIVKVIEKAGGTVSN